MKTNKLVISMLLFFCGLSLLAQNKIHYTYDKNGNRIQKKIIIDSPCSNCPNNNQRQAASVDTAQAIVEMHGINLFPNPTQDKVDLTLSNLKDDEVTSVTVSDEAGKILYSAKNLQAKNEINLANFNNGTYFVRVIIGKDMLTYKVVKIQ